MRRGNLFYLALPFSFICFLLGFWQWHRLDWKETILAQIETKCQDRGYEGSSYLELPSAKAGRSAWQNLDKQKWAFQKVIFRGTLTNKSVRLWRSGKYQTLAIVKIKHGFVLVRFAEETPPQKFPPKTFKAVLYPSQEARFYDVSDDVLKRLYYVANVEKIARDLSVSPVFPLLADLALTCPEPNNRHLSYMLTWWLLMIALPIVAIFARKER